MQQTLSGKLLLASGVLDGAIAIAILGGAFAGWGIANVRHAGERKRHADLLRYVTNLEGRLSAVTQKRPVGKIVPLPEEQRPSGRSAEAQ